MKGKLKITLLILSCFTLMGCPPGNYNDYFLVGNNLNKTEYGYKYILNNKTEFSIKAGSYYSFSKSFQSGISVSFHYDENDQIESFKEEKLKIYSKNFGELKRVENKNFLKLPINDSENFEFYSAELDKKKMKKKKIENDTIFIELNGKQILKFSGKE